jgi:hypothetical protein
MATSRKSAQRLDQSTFWLEEHPASPSQSQESGSDWMIRAATSPLNTLAWLNAFAPAGSFGKMSPASFPLIQTGRRMKAVFDADLKRLKPETNGMKAVISQPSSNSFQNAGMGGLTGFLTLSLPEFLDMREPSLSDEGVSSLSDILETGDLPQHLYLTSRACAGILRRAGKRGKELPPQLARALQAVADLEQTSTLTED